MQKPRVIVIEYQTREQLKNLGKKSESYDKIINNLIQSKEANDAVTKE